MTSPDKPAYESRIPLVSGAVIAVRARPWLAYFLALAALGIGGYAGWQAHRDAVLLGGDHGRLQALEGRLTELRRQQLHVVDDLALKERRVAELESHLAAVDETLGAGRRHAWLLRESGHYLRLAQQHLLLTRDAAGARALLEVTDQLLAEAGDNRLLPLRQAIARDRQALATAQAMDVPGLYLRLGVLGEQVAALKLPPEAGVAAAAGPPAAGAAADSAWARLRGLLLVRRHDEPLRPLLGESERALVRESLRLDLSQAQLGLLRGEPAVYRGSLAAARGRLERYFSLLPSAQLQGLRDELDHLAAVDIRPALPDLSGSLRVLDQLAAASAEAPGVPAGSPSRVAP